MKDIIKSLILTVLLVMVFGIIYPVFIYGVGLLFPQNSTGFPIEKEGKIIGFENIGQKFDSTIYFWSRPSAVDYNAASTGGSNAGNYNPVYLEVVKKRLADFLLAHPYLKASDIPTEMITASGGGLDPHIPVQGALIQVERIAKERNLNEEVLNTLVQNAIEKPYLGVFGVERVNVLKLNLALENLK